MGWGLAGDMAQQLTELTDLPEDPGLITNPHMAASIPGDLEKYRKVQSTARQGKNPD